MTIFEGSAVALVLPMFDNGDIDFEGFKKQVQRMIDGGVQALLVNGTTGETATITIEDEFKLLDLTLELAKGTGVKVICGAGSNDTQTALKKARYAKEKGADAILVVTPYYNKTSQRGLIQHYTTIADAVDIPMILYNVPGRTGLNISVDTVVELAKHKNIQAMKDAVDYDGVDLLGYTMWSPIDIVSASTGEYDKRYGFIYVNYNNNHEGDFSRSKKKSFDWYKHVIETNGEEL